MRWPIAGDLYAVGGVLYTHSLIAYGPESNLARDLHAAGVRLQALADDGRPTDADFVFLSRVRVTP